MKSMSHRKSATLRFARTTLVVLMFGGACSSGSPSNTGTGGTNGSGGRGSGGAASGAGGGGTGGIGAGGVGGIGGTIGIGGAGVGGVIGAGGGIATGGVGVGGVGGPGGMHGIGGVGGAPGNGINVPVVLESPAGTTVATHFHALGAQVYTCTASGAGGSGGAGAGVATYNWVLKSPDAKLYDAAGVQVGTHSQGPTWTSIIDGSAVVGAKVAQSDAPSTDAIPWLLLRAASTSGTGLFTNVTFIQRVNTLKGKAPATGCDATTAAAEKRVDYEADYYFYVGGTPAGLEVPTGAAIAARLQAVGAQVYTCAGAAGGAGGAPTYGWVLKAPDAKLFDAAGAQIGTHSQGPTWTSIADGSTVVGAKVAQVNSPLPDAIPWLMLRAASNSGSGLFSTVTFVHRVNTTKGKAPATGCDSTTAGSEARSDYTADYYFYQDGGTGQGGGAGS